MTFFQDFTAFIRRLTGFLMRILWRLTLFFQDFIAVIRRLTGFLMRIVWWLTALTATENDNESEENDNESDESKICLVCREEMYPNSEILRKLRCKHAFHSKCIGNWQRQKNSCPMCRRKIIKGLPVARRRRRARRGAGTVLLGLFLLFLIWFYAMVRPWLGDFFIRPRWY